jgi:hypothetical protein
MVRDVAKRAAIDVNDWSAAWLLPAAFCRGVIVSAARCAGNRIPSRRINTCCWPGRGWGEHLLAEKTPARNVTAFRDHHPNNCGALPMITDSACEAADSGELQRSARPELNRLRRSGDSVPHDGRLRPGILYGNVLPATTPT